LMSDLLYGFISFRKSRVYLTPELYVLRLI
jgi:hypothetical protein